MTFPSPLYAILDIDVVRAASQRPLDVLDAWLDAGVRLVQLRAKTLASGEVLEVADAAAGACRRAGATFLINDRADIAAMADADGVHVGQDDLPPAAVRAVLGAERLVGLSTHTDGQVEAGCGTPASYLAIGPVFSTATKASANAVVGLEGVARAAARVHAAGRPLVAIGGISLARAPGVLAAGADAVAVISDLMAGGAAARAREYLSALR